MIASIKPSLTSTPKPAPPPESVVIIPIFVSAIAVPAITENNADIIIGNLNTFFIIYPLFKILRIQTSTMKGVCQGTFLKTAYRWF